MRDRKRLPKTPMWTHVGKYLLKVGIAALVAFVLLDLKVKHVQFFAIDGTFGFAAWFGALATFALVLLALAVGSLLRAPGGTYDD